MEDAHEMIERGIQEGEENSLSFTRLRNLLGYFNDVEAFPCSVEQCSDWFYYEKDVYSEDVVWGLLCDSCEVCWCENHLEELCEPQKDEHGSTFCSKECMVQFKIWEKELIKFRSISSY